ncbi:MAG: DNA-3-methyladenine glycosylase 2 family protein [Chloroflexota bacterium]|nr:DNA-3-methyladenine glycosylase 2 family protein [Chloroflexota bacterium]
MTTAPAPTLQQVSGQLTATAPFRLAQSLAFLGGFPPTQGEQVFAPQSVTKALALAGQAVVYRLTADLSDPTTLAYTLWSATPLSAADQAAVADRIAFFLSLGDDLQPFYAIGAADPQFAPIIRQLYGLHQVKFPTPFENAAWAVLTQRNRMDIAAGMKGRLIARYGPHLTVEGTEYAAFPEPGVLATAAPGDLAALVGTARRAEYLQAVAEAFVGADEDWLRHGPYDAVNAWLQGVRGLGPWSAGFVMLRGLGHMDRLPPGEGRRDAALARTYGNDHQPSPDQVRAITEPYGPWIGYWAYYLRVAG